MGDSDGWSTARRAGVVGLAAAADIAVNYPLWIIAKRIGAGLSRPPASEMYKGGGALWLSTGPTTTCEDGVTSALRSLPQFQALKPEASGAVSAGASGVVAAVCVASQVESVIVRAHATGGSVGSALRDVYRARGAVGLVLPPGMAATAAREAPYATALFHVAPAVTQWYASKFPALRKESGDPTVVGRLLAAYTTSVLTSPISHAPSVVAAYQQNHGSSLGDAVREIHAASGVRGFFAGVVARTLALGGTLFVIPGVIRLLDG
eukprot:TRINITY_DN5108_c1_g1_i4.p1 TRINITY_DN5108_c1_g1~~TRINITY_DN5108_c1_g1_i4.p1  ORF type:complete len:264 (+),score=66.39 TRINITY_DN5108_c1_g1_i4:47-838(+)